MEEEARRACPVPDGGPAGVGGQRNGFAVLHFVPALRVRGAPVAPASGPRDGAAIGAASETGGSEK